jgi:hypothetical protein
MPYIPVAVVESGAGSGASSLLAVTAYAPGSDTEIGRVTSATLGDVDATNLQVTFTAPSSGNIVVILTALVGPDAGTPQLFCGVRESTTTLGSTLIDGSSNSSGRRWAAHIYLTGVLSGSHTYKWAAAASAGAHIVYGGPTWGKAIMEVWAAP